jgi:transcriptional regulator with XRE-family HTH domain
MLRLGNTIKRLRERRGLSQRELAEAVDVSSNFLSLVENGHRKLSPTVLEAVAEGLGVPVEVLLWDAVDVPEQLSAAERKTCEAAKRVVANFIERLGADSPAARTR